MTWCLLNPQQYPLVSLGLMLIDQNMQFTHYIHTYANIKMHVHSHGMYTPSLCITTTIITVTQFLYKTLHRFSVKCRSKFTSLCWPKGLLHLVFLQFYFILSAPVGPFGLACEYPPNGPWLWEGSGQAKGSPWVHCWSGPGSDRWRAPGCAQPVSFSPIDWTPASS